MRRARVLVAAMLLIAVTNGRAVHAQPAPVRATAVAATALGDIRSWDAAVDRMARDGDLRVRATVADTLLPGRVHERLDQFYKGVKVVGGDIARQTDGGLTVSIFGTLYQDITIGVEPAISADQARAIVERLSGAALGPLRQPALVILPDIPSSGAAGGYRRVYRAVAFTAADGVEYFIDAATGAVVRQLSAAQRQVAVAQSALGRGTGVLDDPQKMSVMSSTGVFLADDLLRPPRLRTFDMHGNLTRVLDFLNGVVALTVSDRASSSDNVWADGAVVDAHAYAGYVYDYYFKRFGRRGLDNNDVRLLGLVHPVNQADVLSQPSSVQGQYYTNAFYAGSGIMVYGEGLPANIVHIVGSLRQHWTYVSGALDIVAHELTHGVTEFTSNLIYLNESGALNEAFSDMMGTSVEFFYQPAGSGPLKADYLIGEDVVTPGGLRSLADPGSLGDPDHYSKRIGGASDNGGVHTNSTIAAHAFYLSIEGGTNRTSGLAVQGVGAANRDQIEKVFYRGFTQLMPSNATFAVARAVTIQAARDLYGAGSNAERAVTQAWTAVGVS